MAEGVPDLIIPIRMDASKAKAALTTVGAAGRKAGDDVAVGAAKGKRGVQGIESGAGSATKSLLSLGRAQIGFSMIKAAGQAIGSEFKRAADYVKEVANEFAELRKTMQEVATLKGEANSNKFTVEEARKAQGMGLTAAENRDFQAEFLNYARSQVATDEKTGGVAEGAKLTSAQGEEYGGRVAALMKSLGINPAVGAELAGSLLENAKGPQDVDELMAKLSRTFNVLEKGRVPLNRALPQMSQIMGPNIGAEEAAKLFAIASPAAPGQEGNAVESVLKAIEEMKVEDKNQQFGVTEDMSQYESIKAFAENMKKRKEDFMAAGKSENEATVAVARQLKEAGVAADIRERRGLVAGFARQGVKLGGFERYEAIEKNTPEDFEEARKTRYEGSDQGKRNAADIETQVQKIERGAQYQDVELELEKAKARVVRRGDLKQSGLSKIARGATSAYTGVSTEQQIVNEEALRSLGRRATDLGIENPYDDRTMAGNLNVTEKISTRGQADINAEIKEFLKRIAEATEKQTEEKAKPIEPAAPLTIDKAGGANKRQ